LAVQFGREGHHRHQDAWLLGKALGRSNTNPITGLLNDIAWSW